MDDDLLHGTGIGQPGRRSICSSSECVPLEEAHHRIANHLSLLISYVRLMAADIARQSAEPSRDSVRLLLEDICAQINTVGSLHRSLATKGRDEFADLGEHLHEICTPFRSELSGPVKLSENFQRGCVVRLEQILPVSQIVAEVLTNAVKHARADSKAGAILTRCGKDATGAMQVEVIDDGPGLPPNFNPKTDGGLGFRLLRALGKQLNAPMTFESSSHGLHFCLTLPPDPVKQALPGKLLSN